MTAFKRSLRKIDWMDEESTRAATEKVRFFPTVTDKVLIHTQASAIRIKVGFPLSPDTRDPRSIAQYYRQVHVDKYNFFENVLQTV